MKALVTGANGFLGSSIVRELLKHGTEVKVLIRQNSDTRNIDGLDVEKAYGDIRDSDSMKSALKGCDTLYQTAAMFALWAPDSKAFYEINVDGTKTALNAALEQGVEKVVYTSTTLALGAHGVDKPADEEAEYNLWKTGDHYSLSKHLGEVEALKICQKGLPLVIVNPGGLIGIRDIKPTSSGKMILDVLNKKMPAYFDGGAGWADVENVARGHILAAQKGRVGEKYILVDENISLGDFYKLIAEIGGVEPPKFNLPYPVALIVGYMYQSLSRITGKPPVLTASIVRMGSKYAYFESLKAISELGWSQTPIRTAIEKSFNWFRENGYIKGA